MDPVSQGSLGAALAQGGSNPEKIKAATLLGCFGGLAPDLDIFIFSPTASFFLLVGFLAMPALTGFKESAVCFAFFVCALLAFFLVPSATKSNPTVPPVAAVPPCRPTALFFFDFGVKRPCGEVWVTVPLFLPFPATGAGLAAWRLERGRRGVRICDVGV